MTDMNNLISIPKVELHCHLDGSVSLSYLKKQAAIQNLKININKIIVQEKCENLNEYLKSFDEILKVMQTENSLIEGVLDVANQAQKDGVKYIELRFAPSLHMKNDLSILKILNAVCKGAKIAEEKYNILVRIIVCGMKHHTNQANINIFRKIKATYLLKKYIVGVDLAGNEEHDSISKYSEAIDYAKSQKLNITLHAGECGCIKNVYDAVNLGAQRVGHGIVLFQDENQLNKFKNKNVLLEICPKSNIQTKAINKIEEINLKKLKYLNIPYLINTDNRTVSQTNLIEEYKLLLNNNIITIDEIKEINKNALSFAFIEESKKDVLVKHWNSD